MPRGARAALLATLALAWANLLMTGRWAHVPGALHGWRWPYVTTVLGAATVAAFIVRPRSERILGINAIRIIWCAATVLLISTFVVSFPPSTWDSVPFLDNWPPRFQSTVDGIALLRRGTFNGWQWSYLGGYHTASDITQSLTVLGVLPMTILGPAVGWHLLQLLLFLAAPLIVLVDLKEDDREHAILASAFAMLLAGSFSYIFVRSGDTNSVAGLACTALTIAGSHAARRGVRWGWPALVGGFVLTGYSHIGFFAYATLFVLLDALWARDRASFLRGAGAWGIAFVVMLPLTWELLLLPDYFNFNNIVYERGGLPEGPSLMRRIYYNVEMLFSPGRWSNDYSGLTLIFLPIIVYVAWTDRRHRAGFYALAVLCTEVMLRLNAPQFGYVFIRPMHLLPFFTPPVIAWFVLRRVGSRTVALLLVVFVAIYMQIVFPRITHVAGLNEFDAALVSRVRQAPGALVLVENNPHRDMDASPQTSSEPTPFGVHWEALLAAETGRRFYAGFWDGWQWSPWRGQTLAGGAIFGRQIALVPIDEFEQELRRWGIRRLLVWSDASVRYLRQHAVFTPTWRSGRWHEFAYGIRPASDVVTASGSGRLVDFSPLRATILLTDVRKGDEVVVRMNHYPVWELWSGGSRVPYYARDGQLAFRAASEGSQMLQLVYPRRLWLSATAVAFLLIGLLPPAVTRLRSSRIPRRAAAVSSDLRSS